MSFQEPVWLFLAPILLLTFGVILAYGFRRRDTLLSSFAASRLLDQLTEKASLTRTSIKAGCVLLAVAAISIALARPQLGVEWSERKARGLDIVFVLDSSKSMLATDLRPTRLDRAKLAIIDLIERLESDRIGLVAFAGQAFLQTPPTLDYAAFHESLDAIDPNIMTSGGSDLGNAIREASEAFPSENNVKVLVLLTDGEDLGGNAAKAAQAAQKDGIQIFAIGIGTPEGEYLKIRNDQGIDELLYDSAGQPVRSQLDEATLQAIAKATGGSYSRLSSQSLDQLYSNVLATLPREERASELQEIHIERFQWALSLAMFFLVLEILIRRRRSAAIHTSLILLLTLGFNPNISEAQSTIAAENLEREPNSDQQDPNDTSENIPQKPDARSSYNAAYQALTEGDYESARTGYETALTQTNDLDLQRDALYNMAHVTNQQARASYQGGDPQTALKQIKEAEALFNSAKEIDPNDSSIEQDLQQVSSVRKTIEELIEQQKEQQDQNQQSDQSQDSEDSGQQGEQSEENQDSQDSQQNQDESQAGDQSQQSEDSKQDQDQQSDGSEQSSQDQQGDATEQSPQNQNQAEQNQHPEASNTPQDQAPTNGEEQADSEDSATQGAEPESSEEPSDESPQPQPGQESEDANDEESGQTAGAASESNDAEANEEGSDAASSMNAATIEGMTEAEAAALLDTLRNNETPLPFYGQPRNGPQQDTRDW